MPALISREYRIYLALWRKALNSSEPLIIQAPNTNMAIAMRQGMYRAIRPFREGRASDNELLKACEKYVIYIVKGEPSFIEFRERKTLAALESDWKALGISEEDLLFGDERKNDQVMKDLLKETSKPMVEVKTPFYSREG